MATKKIKFEYYEVVCSNGSVIDRPFDLELWIGQIDKIVLKKRNIDYYDERARLDRIRFNGIEETWFLRFLRLRNDIPSIAREDREAEPMELGDNEFVGEEACAIYDGNRHILMLQRNFHMLDVVKGV